MPDDLILDAPYALVRADPAVPCIIVQLHAFANRDQFKQLMNAGLDYYKARTQPTRRWGWIADTRHMSAIPREVQQWLAEEWNKHAYQAGLREVSIVKATNILGQLATQQYAEQALAQRPHYTLEPVYYESLEAAKRTVAQHCAALSVLPAHGQLSR
jgi:hypothetical protein